MSKRKSKVQYYLDIAREVASRSPCSRRKFGAVIVKDDQIIASGYNGTARGTWNCGTEIPCIKDIVGEPTTISYDFCPSVHAEENACLNAGRNAFGGTLYLSPLEGAGDMPCFRCRRAMLNVQLEDIYYINKNGDISHEMVKYFIRLDNEWMREKLNSGTP